MRLFVAATFPEEILRDLERHVAPVKPKLPPASWVRSETQHLTFAFLGEQEESLVAKIAPPLTESLAKLPRFEARLKGCGFFPNPRHARVGWIGLEPEQPFAQIASVVRDVVTKAGVTLDRADFRPHLTLMRMREGWPPASIDLFTRTLRLFASEPFAVQKVVLFQSQLNPKGAVHTAVKGFPLA